MAPTGMRHASSAVAAGSRITRAASRQLPAHPPASRPRIDLYWLPLGAGAHVVRWSSWLYEALVAVRQRRRRCALYHAALEVHLDGDRYVIEMAPVWDREEPDRGVVAEGSVGLPWLGRWRWFRYEIRRWRDGVIPDRAHAVDSPRRFDTTMRQAQRLMALIPAFPAVTWGRDELATGDMWNSNSLIAWLLASTGHDLDAAHPPSGGRAPGWSAGLILAARHPPEHDPSLRAVSRARVRLPPGNGG